MKTIKYNIGGLLLGSLFVLASCGSSQPNSELESSTQHDVSMYPEAKSGQKRVVITVPEKKNESDYKIELIAGKNTKVDCNRQGLIGELNELNLEGWGYHYYEFKTNGEVFSTMMGCPENQPLKDQFIFAPSLMVSYNSKLPYVVYLPKGYELKYKIWSVSETKTAK